MAVNHAKNRQTLKKAHDIYHNSGHEAFRETKPKSYYPFGRRKGAGLVRTEAFRENFDAISWTKKEESKDMAPNDDMGRDGTAGTK